jgi:Protein of unknown function (DUF1592)/Protein of unknown function (DUF1588)/Protein of unknown function (DUF1595)/Protein of unknown function (DUF1585)/Protein of unknown function (DUF1587)
MALRRRVSMSIGFGGILVWTASVLAGCNGTIESPTEWRKGGGPSPPGTSSDPGAPSSADDPGLLGGNTAPSGATYVPAPSTLRRLTVAQYQNSVHDLFGESVTIPADLEPDTVLNGFASIGAARIALSPHATEQFETSAFSIAHQVLADPAGRGAVVGCTPSGTKDDACAREVVGGVGRRAFRRPLVDEEVSRYASLVTQAADKLGDFFAGLEYGLAGILESPHFLYREEIGTPDPSDASRRIFDGYELATRLSFLLWNSTPDDALLDAAASGALSTEAGLLAEATRLLGGPRSLRVVESFFGELLHLADLEDLPQLPGLFPEVTATLGASMRGETLRSIEDVVTGRDADFRELFDGPSTFVNSELASLYGLPAPAGGDFTKVALPASGLRVGLLGQGSFLALNAHADSTSPTRRGKFIREVLLCQAIPPPPPNVKTELPPDPVGQPPRTMRQKLETHRASAACASCHALMDPLGLGLENFDAVGALRTTEVGQSIDASGDLDGVHFANPRQLADAIKNHPDVGTCLARGVFRYATGHVETDGEEPLIQALAGRLSADGYSFRSLLVSVIKSAGFRYAGTPQ